MDNRWAKDLKKYRWPSGKCKSNPERDISLLPSKWLKSKTQTESNTGEKMEKVFVTLSSQVNKSLGRKRMLYYYGYSNL